MQHNLPRQRVLPACLPRPQLRLKPLATRRRRARAYPLGAVSAAYAASAASVAVGVAVNEYFSQVNFHSYYDSASPSKLESSCRCAAPLADYISLASPSPHPTSPQLSTSLADESETRRSAKKLRIRRVDAADLY